MTQRTQSADGVVHEFPDEASPETVDRAMKDYAKKMKVGDSGTEPSTKLQRFGTGITDPIYGAAQIGARMLDPGEEIGLMLAGKDPSSAIAERSAAVDKIVRQREEDYRKRRAAAGSEGFDWMRTGGNIVGTAPVAAAGGLAGGIPGGIMGGVLTNILSPAEGKNYGEQKFQQGLMGAAFGGLGTAGTKLIGAVVGPTVRETAKILMDHGVELTPGQIAGGILRRAEEAAKSFPILGSFIRGAEGRSVETFNRASIDQALEPIGIKLPTQAKIGHDAISYARLRLDDAYDNLLPKMQLAMDEKLSSDIANVRYLASELPEAQAKQFDTVMQNRVAKPFLDTGSITGQKLKQMESDLNSIASSYRSSADSGQRELAHKLDEVRGAIRDALGRQNQGFSDTLQKINSSYAMFTRIESAAARRAGSRGVFTPGDLLQSIKSADKSVRKGQFARGDALMQDFAEFADTVLPSKLPDSGTTERAMWDMLGLGTALVKPAIPVGLGAASVPYTKAATSLINRLARPSAARAAMGQNIRRASPVVGTMATPALTAVTPTLDTDIDNTVSTAAGQ